MKYKSKGFLESFQVDILTRTGWYWGFCIALMFSFFVTMPDIIIYSVSLRAGLCISASVILLMVYFGCKCSRTQKEDRDLLWHLAFMLPMTAFQCYDFFRAIP